jgi:hypothetical protein
LLPELRKLREPFIFLWHTAAVMTGEHTPGSRNSEYATSSLALSPGPTVPRLLRRD